MPRRKLDPYDCPRCGYQTCISTHMRDHLFKSKKPCPGIVNDIELTDEMKQ